MTSLAVTPWAALLTLLFITVSVRVILARRGAKVAIGTGGNPALERAARVQANFAEYVPLALLLLVLVELAGYPAWLVHLLGAALLTGRLLHAWGLSRTPENFRFRVTGMVVTLNLLGLLALLLPVASLLGVG